MPNNNPDTLQCCTFAGINSNRDNDNNNNDIDDGNNIITEEEKKQNNNDDELWKIRKHKDIHDKQQLTGVLLVFFLDSI